MFTYDLTPFVSVRPSGAIVKSQISYLPDSDNLDLLIKAARVTPQERREEMEPGALEYVIDVMRTTKAPAWEVLFDEIEEILGRPGPGMAFTELLTNAEHWRLECEDISGVVRAKIDQMIDYLVALAHAQMDAYLERREGAQRPADIYRTFGPALRYATHTLGSFAARKMMQELSLQTTMPFSELDNPDWIDPYTGRGEKKYEQVRVRKVELSSDGNSDEMPVILADLLETLEEGGVTTYGFKNGQLVKEQMEPMDKKTEPPRWLESWWDEFDNAQRGGFNAEADEGDEHVEPEFDVIDKDFEGKSEFEFTEALDGLRALYAKELAEMRNIVREYSDGLTILRRNPEIVAHATKWVQSLIRHSPPFVRFLKFMRAIAHEQEPQDLLALILPFQTETGYTLEDLSTIKIPGQCRDLDEYYRMYQDQILDQFQDEPGRMGSEPTGDELDEFVSEEIHERVRVYLSPLGNLKYHQAYRDFKPEKNYKTAREFQAARLDAAWAAFWEAQKRSMVGQRYLPHAKVAWKEVYASTSNEQDAWKAFWAECATQRDARYTPEFVEAEMMAAIMGDGSQGSAFKAGWDAWRAKISPEANRAYHAALREGQKPAEAMKVFWREVEAHKNKIVGITAKGLKLGNGREIDWGIARLKLTKGELRLTVEELTRLAGLLEDKRWGVQFAGAIRAKLAAMVVV